MQDNSDLQHKLRIRQKALAGSRPQLVVDAYAGQGVIAGMFWRHLADRVICIEKNGKKAGCIKHGGNVGVVCGDNRDYLDICQKADVVDCDAYGLVMPYIKLLRSWAKPGTLIVFTDGSPTKKHKVCMAENMFYSEIKNLLSGWHIEKNAGETAFYGYGYLK